MFKKKLCGFAIACMMGLVGMSPVNVFAAEANSETSATISEKDQKDKKSNFEDTMKAANEKWNTLTEKQKAEVYTLLEDEMKAEFKLMDKLVELGVIGKEDATFIKSRMQQKFDELKKTGEFPLARPKREKK